MQTRVMALSWMLVVLPALSSPSRAIVTHNRLATNRLATNRLSTNALSSDSLTADPSADELLSTPEGRDLYSYIVGCALPAGMDIQATIPGAPDTDAQSDLPYTCANEQCVFSGSIGLMPKWTRHKLSRKGQEWISACLLARVNAHDTVEPISMRGHHPALAASPEELLEFPLQEGAFYGNVFIPDPDPQDLNACRGQDQAGGETGGLVDRDCAEPDPSDPTHTQCGFTFAGDCADYTPVVPTPYACAKFELTAGFYLKCHAVPGVGTWPQARPYKLVITTYVKP